MKYLRAISAVVVFVVGCESTYVGPSVGHVYTTDTQAAHTLTGLEVHITSPQGAFDKLDRLSNPPIIIFIDGREAVRTKDWYRQTFVQLPPGEHKLRVYAGNVLIGHGQDVFAFALEEGHKGLFKLDAHQWFSSHFNREWWNRWGQGFYEFENVASSAWLTAR